MKKLVYALVLGWALAMGACNDEESDNKDNFVSIENNTVAVGNETATLTSCSANYVSNPKGYHIEIYCYDTDIRYSTSSLKLNVMEIPTGNTTLTWQTGSNIPEAIKANEFTAQVEVNDSVWFAGTTENGYDVMNEEMQVTLNNGKITFAFEGISLADNAILSNQTERRFCGGKITIPFSTLKYLRGGGVGAELVDE